MRPPYLLLDIDGVLIPFPSADGSTPATHARHDVVPTGRSPTTRSPSGSALATASRSWT